MTLPTLPRRHMYLQIDDMTFQTPLQKPAQLMAQLTAAAAAGEATTVQVIDVKGDPVEALVLPGNARLVSVSLAQVEVRKGRPPST